MNKRKALIATISVVILAVLLGGLYYAKQKKSDADVDNTRTVSLYYYSLDKDKDASGNAACSDKALVAVERKIPKTETPIEDTLRLFLTGDLDGAEREKGITTEYPLKGVTLNSVNLKDGVLTLDLSDPNHSTGGGSCRVSILRSQLEATARQFKEVTSVKFTNPDLFQP